MVFSWPYTVLLGETAAAAAAGPPRVSSGTLKSEANQRPTVARKLTAFDIVFVRI